MSRSYWNAFQNDIEKDNVDNQEKQNKNKIPVGEHQSLLQKDADT
jgi:hypothetical protein